MHNKTLNEYARSMRIDVGLPKMFWAEVVSTTTYLVNHGPIVSLGERFWSGKEVNISYLRVLGCIFYVHIDSFERSKLELKSRKCAFISYDTNEFGYQFWDYENRQIIWSRDDIIIKQYTRTDYMQKLPTLMPNLT